MDPDQIARIQRYRDIAHSLSLASALYQKAGDQLEADPNSQEYYHAIKEANHLVDSSFPEKFQVHKTITPSKELKSSFDWGNFLKILIPVLIVLAALLFLVFSGTTGDMTKTWNSEEVIKNSQYPKEGK